MVSVDGTWSREEAASFLEAALVPIRLGCHDRNGRLWMLSLWYRYRDGYFECATASDADVVAFLRANDEVCFEVSTNAPPYMGVRGRGTASVETEGGTELLGALVDRYLGTREGAMGEWLLREEREEVAIRIDPDRLYTWDFTPRMREAMADSPAGRRTEPSSPKYD